MSPLDTVPKDVWQRIFLFLAPHNHPGPPSDIIPIILTNHHMHEILCSCKNGNAHLYADIFSNYYDLPAPRRRLGFSLTTSSRCSMELRDRFACLKRIRHRTHHSCHPDILTSDLCRCVCILLESDYKNSQLLLQYAELPAFVLDSAQTYLSETHTELSHPIAHVSFLLWLLWLISTYDNLVAEDLQITNELQDRVAPYAISAWLYQDYPPVPSPFPNDASRPFPSNLTSPSYTITMFGHSVSLKPLSLSPAAILVFCPRADAYLIRWARSTTNIGDSQESVDRADRLLSSSVAGLYSTDDSGENPLINHLFSTPSERFDDDWQRLLPSLDTESETSAVRPFHNTPFNLPRLFAVISGTWEGRMEYPDYNQYMSLRDSVTNDIQSFRNLFITSTHLTCFLQVFYCTNSTDMLRTPDDSNSILNAWFPPDDEIELTYTNHGDLRIWDRLTKRLAMYELWRPNEEVPDTNEICDVIIVGHNISTDPGLAARYAGRVTRDGLIILLRDGPQRGKELIRGYIHHGRNFVGRWRTTATPAESSTWEGPFIMARRDD